MQYNLADPEVKSNFLKNREHFRVLEIGKELLQILKRSWKKVLRLLKKS